MSRVFTSSQFFQALPAQLRPHLPADLRRFQHRTRAWMLQTYYDDFAVHYEASAYSRLQAFEIALHFERKGHELNGALMRHCLHYAFELKHMFGAQIEFERWDKGWSKIYEMLPLASYTEEYLARVAERMAKLMACLQPILDEVVSR
jgi:hypothetical protein